ncbi:hypothetical protein CEXT_485131 [Caerostris extrusa]|uniref:Uncharacterized protein n=1 Tax=Caerostris extrusa TaxID=172846 RepID=A0AAV4Q4X3_CAEEX|nr:hypothetical protein CEXT_485131 [Caerostris extrusa]
MLLCTITDADNKRINKVPFTQNGSIASKTFSKTLQIRFFRTAFSFLVESQDGLRLVCGRVHPSFLKVFSRDTISSGSSTIDNFFDVPPMQRTLMDEKSRVFPSNPPFYTDRGKKYTKTVLLFFSVHYKLDRA